jgi:LysM repeat protein
MPNWLTRIFASASAATSTFSAEAIQQQIATLKQLLGDGQPAHSTVRMWVDSGASYGHQSSTASLMYRIARPVDAAGLNLGYAGTVEVYYETDADLAKLYTLVPEMGGQAQHAVGNATVKLIKYDATNPPATTVSLGLTGGTGYVGDYAAKLNVDYFLWLQPFNWKGREAIQFKSGRAEIELTTVAAVGAEQFKRRLYCVDRSMYENPPWQDFLDGPWTAYEKEKVKIVRDLFGADVLPYQVQAAYSIKSLVSRMNVNPTFAAAIVCASALEWQKAGSKPYKKAKPVVIVNFDEFGAAGDPSAEHDLRAVLTGELASDEQAFKHSIANNDRNAIDNFTRRAEYFKALKASDRFHYLNYPMTLGAVQAEIAKLANQNEAVLFVQLGRSFPAVFSYALFKSTLPPVFEGQNSANDAVNIGRPYMQVPAPDMSDEQKLAMYPSVTLLQYASQTEPQDLVRVAGEVSSPPMVWPTVASKAPPRVIGGYYQQYTDETHGSDTIRRYFSAVREFFARPDQDKLFLALAYLTSLLPRQPALVAAATIPNPLDALWDGIDKAVKQGGPVDLVPGIMTTGAIADFIQAFLKDFSGGLTLTVSSFEPAAKPDPLEKITLAGSTEAFASIGVKNTISIVFTAPDGKLTADFTFTADEKWSMPEAPWMVFERPFVQLTVPDASLPVAATIGGYYPALEQGDKIVAKLQIAIGGADGRWPASITFGPGYPDIAKAYQLATGFNVVKSLPAPFNVAADLGIKSIEVDYDYANTTVDSIAVVAQSNTPGLTLVGNLKLDNLTVSAVVLNPTTTRDLILGVSAEFGIGTGAHPAVVTISFNYPDIVLQGTLTSGTPTFTDLLATFVPELEGISLPHEPTLDKFDFMYNKSNDYLAVSTQLTMPGWDFVFPGFTDPVFSLDTVAFAITRDKGTNTGSVIAHTTLLPTSGAPIGVDIGGEYLANKDLKLFAKTTTVVDVDTLVREYLGDGWVPVGVTLPKLKDLGVTLLWGKKDKVSAATAKSFEFTAKTATPWQPIDALGSELSVTADLTIGYREGKPKPAEPATATAVLARSNGPVIGARTAGDPATALAVPAPAPPEKAGLYGKLSADVTLWYIHLKVEFDFDPEVKKVCVTWTDIGLKACLEKNSKGETIATFTLENQTVDSMIEKFVSWATGTEFGLLAPFNVLDDISLSGLKVTYNFTKKKVDFTVDIGPIDLGLFKITGITLAYNPDGNDDGKSKNKVQLTVNGSFVWQSGDSLNWEPDDPSTTPAPPGGGNKYFDLRLLALGQHVTVPGLLEKTNVQGVIEALEALEIPKPPEIPIGGANQPTFDATSSWFVAFDFGILKVETKAPAGPAVGAANGATPAANLPATTGEPSADVPQYFISLAIVFNDPHLYGLRIALEGPMAKVFAGLDFQIMYQQVSKTVGRYSAQIALPMIMRKFQIGVASITLPTFAIEVYTNGDFQIDIGFPWKQDFSRSFSIEVQAGPVPVIGSAGFYFGKLSSATTDKVPKDTRPGWFNPVIVFGFGAQIGLGKSIEAGILSAGFSVTVFGIIEGVIARWQPYKEVTRGGDKSSLQDGYYFALSGTFGLQGRLYGSINFAIVSAELDVRISMYVRITFASYQPIPITAAAAVSVRLTVKIGVGFFSISIHLSFKASIEVTFVLDNPMGKPSDAPWAPIAGSLMAMSAPHRLSARGLARGSSTGADGFDTADAAPFTPTWANLEQGPRLQMKGWVAPVLTVAGDIAAQPDQQKVCYVLNFFVDAGAPPVHTGDGLSAMSADPGDARVVAASQVAQVAHDRARKATTVGASADDDPKTFDDLAIRVLEWVIAAGQDGPRTPDEVDKLVVSDDFLASALTYLSGATTPTPVGGADIEKFLQAQTKFRFGLEQDKTPDGQPVSAVFFPAAPGLSLDVPAFGGQGPFHYSFGGYNSSSADYLSKLNDYFNELKVQVSQEEPDAAFDVADAATGDGPSVATYIFGDYFAMIGRLTIQAMRDGLRDFKLVLGDHKGQTSQEIVAAINTTGALGGADAYTVGELLAANQTHPLDPAAAVAGGGAGIAITAMTWRSPGAKSFTAIAAESVFAGGFDATALALANAASARIIAAGVQILATGASYRTQSGDSLETIAIALGFVGADEQADVAKLLIAVPDLLTSADLLAPQSILAVPAFRHTVVSSDTVQSVVAQYAITIDALAAANGDVTSLFLDNPNNLTLDVPHLPQYQVGELIDEMKRTLALQHMGAMASRYYLHGLRLPTKFATGGLTPKADGLFVKAGGAYPDDLGLFALTGQAFPLGDIPDPSTGKPADAKYQFTVDGASESWLSFGAAGDPSVTFTLSASADYQRYSAVKRVAGTFLDTVTRDVRPIDVGGVKPSRYPLSTEIAWQPAVDVILPTQPSAPANPKPRLWQLPDELINVPDGGAVHPTIKPLLARSDEATGTTIDEDVANYGFGTLVTFKVKKLPGATASGPTQRTYEIIGAPESEITLLERLLDQLTGDASSFDAVNLLYRPSSTGSEVKGWQSDDPASSLMGITQTNLSTETRPPVSSALLAARAATSHSNLIGTPNAFLRLLWEASITRQGGFYLGYTTGIGGDLKGLPDHAFNDRDEAEVAVAAIFEAGSGSGQALKNFMNVAVTNEAFDLSHAALVAEAVPVIVAAPRRFARSDSLSSYAASYYTGPGVLAEENAPVAFAPGVSLTVAGGLYQVPPNPTASPTPQDPGANLALIATHFGTSPAAIRAVNAGQLPDSLAALTAIKLPTVTAASDGQSLQRLADYYGVPVAELAAANLHVAGLYPAAPLAVSIGPASLTPIVRRGVAGMRLRRAAPQVPDSPDGNWGVEYLRQNFSLLAYRVATNNGNDYFPQSAWGLPSGPVDPDATPPLDKIQAPRTPAAGDPWNFTFSVPYASVLAKGKDTASPYAGVGDILQFELAWLDIFGNRILSELANPAPAAGAPRQRQPQLLGYADRLVGIGQWPAVANAYRVVLDGTAPSLVLQLDFDASSYQEAAAAIGSDNSAAQAGENKLAQGIAAYTLISEQLADPSGVTIELSTSVTPSAIWTLPGDDPGVPATGVPASVRAWAATILAWLQAVASAPGTPPPAGYESTVALDASAINTDQIFKLETALTVRRPKQLVAGELATVAGVAEASTSIAPFTGSLTTKDETQPQRSLTAFAKDFAGAFASLDGIGLRIATGADRERFTGTGASSPLWVVQLGETGAGKPISFTIADAGDPTVYAPRPISNVLASRASTAIIQYTTGSVIQLDGAYIDQAFTSIDLDKWMVSTLGSIDELFTPKYTAAADILRRNIASVDGTWPDALEQLVEAKKKLANNLRSVMIPVYKGESANDPQLADIREAFYQSMLAMLGGFYGVTAGIQFTADVKAAIKREPGATRVPRVFGDMVMGAVALPPQPPEGADPLATASGDTKVSVSSPKLDLPFADPDAGTPPPSPYLSSLVSSSSVEASSVSLNLSYQGQYIEHEIGQLAGIEGYEPSSWLSFVDIRDPEARDERPNPLHAELGTFEVPIVLREFPATPTLVNQDKLAPLISPCYEPRTGDAEDASAGSLLAGIDCDRAGPYDPLAAATRWNYSFTYALQVHHQQDEIHGAVRFNIVERRNLMAFTGPKRDVFDNLAQFTQVYPQVQADLNAYLVPIDVDTTDATVLKNAQTALESAAAMIDWLATSPPGLPTANGAPTALAADGSVGFTISEGEETIGGVNALTISVKLSAALPARVGKPLVEIDGYTCELQASSGGLTSVFAYKTEDGSYLPASVGMNIAARTFVLPDLDILERQDAQTEVYITRNADLVAHKTIDDPFVYTTPKVSFDEPLHPTLVVDDTINLATIFSTGPKNPVKRSLDCQLGLLYDALFANAGTPDVTMQASLYYEYEIASGIAKVRLPVYLMPPTPTRLRADGAGTPLADVITMQVAGWTDWFSANTPETLGGALVLDLTVMSDLTAQPMPILHLTGLYAPFSELA